MANGQPVIIHQALHGYTDGHREISSSIKLSPRDARTLLVMSDLANAGGSLTGYVTGYPLVESQLYVLARTWPATEMPRPGCAWTHTLFIRFDDLGRFSNGDDLLSTFRRPTSDLLPAYDQEIILTETMARPLCLSNNAVAWTRQLLYALYDRPTDKIVGTYPAELDPAPIAVAIWLQQWPQLRRTFCFCTATAADRTTDRFWFDLQLTAPADRTRAKFPGALFPSDVPEEEDGWVEDALNDLMAPDHSTLRQFLRDTSGNLPNGRHMFASLTKLHQLLGGVAADAHAIDTAIDILDATVPSPQVMTVRKKMLEHAAKNALGLSRRALGTLVADISLLTEDVIREHGPTIVRAVLANLPDHFGTLLNAGNLVTTSIDETIAQMSACDLMEVVTKAPHLADITFDRRPELATMPAAWEKEGPLRDAALASARAHPELQEAFVTAILDSGKADLAHRAVNAFDADLVWLTLDKVLEQTSGYTVDSLRPWLAAAILDSNAVAHALTSGAIHSFTMLVEVARMTDPDDVPNEIGEDPWVAAIRRTTDLIDEQASVFLKSYLLSRALGRRSKNRAELATVAFQTVYRAAGHSSMPDDAWALLEHRLPVVPYWSRWDRCEQLRHGIVGLFIGNDLDARVFADLPQDDKAFADLIRTARKAWGSYSYLRRVRKILAHAGTDEAARRLEILEAT